MAVHLPNSIFFHIPKTGGTWVRWAMHNAGIPINELGPRIQGIRNRQMDSMHHCTPDAINTNGAFTFAFVRNPLTYYQSFWSHRMRDWAKPKVVDWSSEKYMNANFSDFLHAVLDDCPGWLSLEYRSFAGIDGKKVSFIGHQESLADDLVHALTLADETFDEAALRATPFRNVAYAETEFKKGCQYTPALAEKVIESEIEAFTLYGYSTDPNQVLREPNVVRERVYA